MSKFSFSPKTIGRRCAASAVAALAAFSLSACLGGTSAPAGTTTQTAAPTAVASSTAAGTAPVVAAPAATSQAATQAAAVPASTVAPVVGTPVVVKPKPSNPCYAGVDFGSLGGTTPVRLPVGQLTGFRAGGTTAWLDPLPASVVTEMGPFAVALPVADHNVRGVVTSNQVATDLTDLGAIIPELGNAFPNGVVDEGQSPWMRLPVAMMGPNGRVAFGFVVDSLAYSQTAYDVRGVAGLQNPRASTRVDVSPQIRTCLGNGRVTMRIIPRSSLPSELRTVGNGLTPRWTRR